MLSTSNTLLFFSLESELKRTIKKGVAFERAGHDDAGRDGARFQPTFRLHSLLQHAAYYTPGCWLALDTSIVFSLASTNYNPVAHSGALRPRYTSLVL